MCGNQIKGRGVNKHLLWFPPRGVGITKEPSPSIFVSQIHSLPGSWRIHAVEMLLRVRSHKTLSWFFIYLFLRVWDVGLCSASVLAYDNSNNKWWWIGLRKLVPERGGGDGCLPVAGPICVHLVGCPVHPASPPGTSVRAPLVLCWSLTAGATRTLLSYSHFTF